MANTQERATTDVRESVSGVDETAAPVDGTTPSALEGTTGAVGALVGMLTGGFVIAAAAGFVVGVVFGVAIGRRATPTPRWQVWR